MDIEWQSVGPSAVAEARDGVDVVIEALERCDAVGEFFDCAVSEGEPVLLLVNDGHRSTRTREALIALSTILERRAHVPRFRALIGTGTHRFDESERAEFERAVLDEGIGKSVRIDEIAWHDAFDTKVLVDVAGVELHSWLAGGRFLLPIGSVEPHYFAGMTGAHKTVTIGCMSRRSIERNHAHAMSPDSEIAVLDGNPVYDDIVHTLHNLESAGKRILAINQIVLDGAVIASEAGGPIETLKALLPSAQRVYLRRVSKPVDLLHLKVPLPLGRNLYQADKALKNNHPAVRDGGGILLEASCAEGVGPDAFLNLLRKTGSYAEAVRCVEDEGYSLGDHKAVKLRFLTDPACRGVHVALVSPHFPEKDAEVVGIKVFTDAASAIPWLIRTIGEPSTSGLIIEDAANVAVSGFSRGRSRVERC